MTARRIGWLGGSFDPVHEGHLFIARKAAARFHLDEVLLIPAARPPHKLERELAPGADRLALLELACAEDELLVPCGLELNRDGPSYSHDTALALRDRLGPDARLFFIIGADTLADLPTWHRIADLCQLVTFCALTREGTPLDPSPLRELLGRGPVARMASHMMEVEPHPASSTAIRAALARGERPAHLPDAVYAAILERGLYGAGGASSKDSSGCSIE